MNNKYTVVDLFAGAGGLSKAFQEVGAEIVWANEIDKNACILYRENFKDVCLDEGDIKDIKSEKIPDFDILVGGFPCCLFSITGKGRGVADERGNLFYEIIRILKAKRPRAFLLENTKELKSHNNGRNFEIISQALQNEGYYIKSAVLNSKEYGNMPHNKAKMYIVGFRNVKAFQMFEFPGKVQLTNGVSDIINLSDIKDEKYYSGKNIEILKEIKGEKIKREVIYQLRYYQNKKESYVISEFDTCPALTLYIKDNKYIPMVKDDFGIRMLTSSECFSFQGFCDIKIPIKINENMLYRYASSCSSVTVIERIAENIIKTLDYSIQYVKLKSSLENNTEQQNMINNEDECVSKDIINGKKREEESVQTIEKFIKKDEIYNEIKLQTSIKNEKEFTLHKVIPALKRKKFSDIRYNHGIDEYGKDVTYKYNDNFGSVKYGAAQVKYGEISGGAKGEIDVILSQIEDAFEMPYIDIIEGRENYISQLLVVCSGKYTQNAKAKVLKKLKKGYDVRFFDGQDIDNLLDE